MQMRVNNFSTEQPDLPFVSPGKASACENGVNVAPRIKTPIGSVDNPNVGTSPYTPTTAPFITYTIPSGSRIKIKADFLRKGNAFACSQRFGPDVDLTLTATQDYDNFVEWWEGDGVAALLNNGPKGTDSPTACEPENVYIPTILKTSLGQSAASVPSEECKNYWQFLENDVNTSSGFGEVSLIVTGYVGLWSW